MVAWGGVMCALMLATYRKPRVGPWELQDLQAWVSAQLDHCHSLTLTHPALLENVKLAHFLLMLLRAHVSREGWSHCTSSWIEFHFRRERKDPGRRPWAWVMGKCPPVTAPTWVNSFLYSSVCYLLRGRHCICFASHCILTSSVMPNMLQSINIYLLNKCMTEWINAKTVDQSMAEDIALLK